MTYKQLLSYIQTLDKEQMDREVFVYDSSQDVFYDDGTQFRITSKSVPGLIDNNFPYLVV